MARQSRQPFSETGKFVASKNFRFAGKSYKVGDDFPWRRLGCTTRRLQQLWEGRFINAKDAPVDRSGEEFEQEEFTDDPSLFGSSVQPATFELANGDIIQLGDVVNMAWTESGLETAKEWNALSEEDREKHIAEAVATLDLKKEGGDDETEEEEEDLDNEDETEEGDDTEESEGEVDFTFDPKLHKIDNPDRGVWVVLDKKTKQKLHDLPAKLAKKLRKAKAPTAIKV